MNAEPAKCVAPIYPAYCFPSSPTYDKWVKLTAADVHVLRSESPFEAQNIFFHLNHPIRYVYLSGPVVGIDFIAPNRTTRRWVTLTLDDSSGRTIEISAEIKVPSLSTSNTTKKVESQSDPGVPHRWKTNNYVKLNRPAAQETQEREGSSSESEVDAKDEVLPEDTHVFKLFNSDTATSPAILDTDAPCLKVTSVCKDRRCHDKHVVIDNQIVDIGMVYKVRATLKLYRGVFQLMPKRMSAVRASDEEARIWTEYADFCGEVLSKPWQVSDEQIAASEAGKKNAAKEEREKQKKAELREAQKQAYREKLAKLESKAEAKRQAMVSDLNGNPLDRKDWKPMKQASRSSKVRS